MKNIIDSFYNMKPFPVILIILLIILLVCICCLIREEKIKIANGIKTPNVLLVKQSRERLYKEVSLWQENYICGKPLKKDQLFSPKTMKNGEVNCDNMIVEVHDYARNVPWFMHKGE